MTLSTEPMTIRVNKLARQPQEASYTPYQEESRQDAFVPGAVTHVRTSFGNELSVQELEQRFGLTLEEWHEANERVSRQRTHCILGGKALDLVEFEAQHEHIILSET